MKNGEMLLVSREPSVEALNRAAAFALNVKLGGDYTWSAYMRDLWLTMTDASPALTPADLERAIQAGCSGANIHLACSYPDCACKQAPAIVKAALAELGVKTDG